MISVKITPVKGGDPTTVIDVNGHVGGNCENLTRGLEEALGARTSQELKAEYFEGQVCPEQNVNLDE